MNSIIKAPDNFYPTPKSLVDKMLSDIDFSKKHTFLEPSAGVGAIIRGIAEKYNAENPYGRSDRIDVDCIELDAHLQQILSYNFSSKRKQEIGLRIREIEDGRKYNRELRDYEKYSDSQKAELEALKGELSSFPKSGIHLVHNDFLSFHTHKRYDVIIMNPPFDGGDRHLIKAIELQRRGGDIVCLLNAETVRNPYTNVRKHLVGLLDKHEAEIQYLQGEFATSEAERKTGVEVALIRLSISEPENKSFIFETLHKAQEQEIKKRESTELTVGGFIENIIDRFNLEVRCGLELIREYMAMKPYMLKGFGETGAAMLTLSLSTGESNYVQTVDVNKYMQNVRIKYWRELFNRPEFTGKLTSNLKEDYDSLVERLKDYDFTLFNIQQIQEEMTSKLTKGVEDTIMALFDKLSAEHTWYPETAKNTHYFDGWATNKAHKINKKVIIPIHGAFSSYSWSKDTFEANGVYTDMSDMEKVFNYLDNGETGEVDLLSVLRDYSNAGITKKIPLKYFNITLYKKGTCHIEFTNQRLLDKFNIYGCRYRKWLPPSYGKKRYSDMSNEERKAVDEFQGKAEYEKVFAETGYYLVETNELLALTEGL